MTRSNPSPLVLLTGASGYIGSRLLRRLENDGCAVRCLARQPERVAANRPTTEVVRGECLDEPSLDAALQGVDQAYYLVHSMASGGVFAARDREAAANFARVAARAGVRRIIYLGGLGEDQGSLSTHLKSRLETGEALRKTGVPVVEFRASIVVGAGSLSYEMIRSLVERLPAMICPRWVDTRTQPIAVDDVLAYLRAALDLPDGRDGVFEIAGPDVVSYGDMMREYARLRGLRRWLIPVPVLTPRLSGLWLGLVTPAQARVGRALVEGLRNPTVVRSPMARDTFGVRPMTLREAFARAIDEGGAAQFKIDSRVAVVDAPPEQVFAPIRRIGGATGWYFADALWRLRGWIDGRLGGVGMPRGRRDPDDCGVGDVIDGWRVEAFESNRLLRLSAGLRLPGRGWLEFRVDALDGGARSLIRQTATFDPKGIAGRAYWYGVLPLHAFVFRGLLRRIAQRAVSNVAAADLSRRTSVPHRRRTRIASSSSSRTPVLRLSCSDRRATSRLSRRRRVLETRVDVDERALDPCQALGQIACGNAVLVSDEDQLYRDQQHTSLEEEIVTNALDEQGNGEQRERHDDNETRSEIEMAGDFRHEHSPEGPIEDGRRPAGHLAQTDHRMGSAGRPSPRVTLPPQIGGAALVRDAKSNSSRADSRLG